MEYVVLVSKLGFVVLARGTTAVAALLAYAPLRSWPPAALWLYAATLPQTDCCPTPQH